MRESKFNYKKNTIFNWNNENNKIVVIGDLILDRYIYGNVKISPEAPILALNKTSEEYKLGGALNVALNIKSLNGSQYSYHIYGDDDKLFNEIYKLNKSYNNENNCNTYLMSNKKPTIKTRYICDRHQLLRVDNEDKIEVTDIIIEQINKKLNDIKPKVIVIEDYAKGMINQSMIDMIYKYKKHNTCFILADPHPNSNVNYYKKIDLYKPNLKEAMKLCNINNINVENNNDLFDLLKLVYKKIKCTFICITLGDKGVCYLIDGKHFGTVPIPERYNEVIDVCGCGDVFMSVLALCFASSFHFDNIKIKIDNDIFKSYLEIANIAAGINAEKFGVSIINFDELLERIE